MIRINKTNSILLIDGSYCVFFKYYAVLTWCRLQKLEINIDNILQNDTFTKKYSKMFEKCFTDYVKKYSISWSNVVFFKDAPRETLWRNDIFKGYKCNRDTNREGFNKDIFNYTYNSILPDIQTRYKGFQVFEMEKMEADDLIGIVKKFIRETSSNVPIYILTNDNDYVQLHDNYTYIINLKYQNICDRIPVPVQQYVEYKILVGDKADCIPPITNKVGDKTAKKMLHDTNVLHELFSKDIHAKEQYEINRNMIDMDCIPKDLCYSVLKNIELN